MREFFLLIALSVLMQFSQAQDQSVPRVVLITLDGMRWQEVFTGADSLLIGNSEFVTDTAGLKARFWRATPGERRQVLFPFLWNEISKMGQVYGNRYLGSKVDLTNQMWFSYPGYNEILTGCADDVRIHSNDKVNNPNITFLEVAGKSDRFRGRVAAFGSWDVFPYIVNEERSGVPVNAGFEPASGDLLTDREKFLNELLPQVPSPWNSVRLDAFTQHYALEYMKREHPKIIYIAYGETDDFAHDGDYQAYLNSANNTDGFIHDLYDFAQQDPFYKGRTVFLITTDHGRGTSPPGSWKSHGEKIMGSGQVWVALFGSGIPAAGERQGEEQLFSAQIAPLVYKLLRLDNPIAKPYPPLPVATGH